MFVYCAGPMTGIPEFNFSAFDSATESLRSMGHSVFSPAEQDRAMGFDPTGMTGRENLSLGKYTLRDMLAKDLEYICLQADAICVLEGWQNSKGARAEVATARALGLRVGYLFDFATGLVLKAEEFLGYEKMEVPL